jgi:hypothetical protein
MASKFSGAVVLTDLNDFISPSQACVLPVATHHDRHSQPVCGCPRAAYVMAAH